MRVVLDAQILCDHKLIHGTSIFAYNLYRTLITRGKNEYILSFFDKNKERGNREKLKEYFSEDEVVFSECNTISYKDVLSDSNVFGNKTYAESTGTYGDVYFCDCSLYMPTKMTEKWIVTHYDFIPLQCEKFRPTSHFVTHMIKTINAMRVWKPHIITITEYVKQEVLRRIPEYKENEVTVTGAGYNSNIHYKEINQDILNELHLHEDYLLFFSPFFSHKNAPLTVEAFNLIANKFPNLRLVMTGRFIDDTQETMSRICRSEFRERIIVTGVVNDNEKRTLISGALAVLYPSLCEGFGLPIIESQTCGTPVITSNTTCMPEVAGDAALLIDPRSTESLASAMEKIIISKSLREDYIKKGYENIKRYSWDLTAEKMEETFEKIYNEL